MFGVADPVLERRAGKLGPRLWAIHFVLRRSTPDSASLPVTSAQPALIYNGDGTSRQHHQRHLRPRPTPRRGVTAALA